MKSQISARLVTRQVRVRAFPEMDSYEPYVHGYNMGMPAPYMGMLARLALEWNAPCGCQFSVYAVDI